MRKMQKLIIISLIYIFIVFIITLNMNKLGNLYVLFLIILSLVFAIFVSLEIFKKVTLKIKPVKQNVEYENIDDKNLQELKIISSRPFILFGSESKLVSDDQLYFDQENFYVINKGNQKAVYKLTDITELSRTSINIRNQTLWQLKIKVKNDNEITIRFAHNYRVWNKNFVLFYDKLKTINPNVVKSKWSLWRM